MAALPAAWGHTHINMSGEDGSKEGARGSGDEERRRWKEKKNCGLNWACEERKYIEKEKENRSG